MRFLSWHRGVARGWRLLLRDHSAQAALGPHVDANTTPVKCDRASRWRHGDAPQQAEAELTPGRRSGVCKPTTQTERWLFIIRV